MSNKLNTTGLQLLWNKVIAAINNVKPTHVSGTLTAGSETITLSDSAITTSSIIEPFASQLNISPTTIEITNGQAILTFPAQSSDMEVMIRVSKR